MLLSLLYRFGVYLHRKCTVSKKAEVPAISVGNITTGGTGKTPVVLKILETIGKEYQVAVLTRGYGRQTKGVLVASETSSFVEIGDEAVVIKNRFPDTMVVAGANRFESAEVAVKNNAEILILDDGFQSYELKRDIDIVVIDCTKPFGGAQVLPLGLLREPLNGLSRADCVILNRSNIVDEKKIDRIKEIIRIDNSDINIFHTYEKVKVFKEISGSNTVNADFFKNKKVLCFCGIGNPVGFYNLLVKSGAVICEKFRRKDHHIWTQNELKMIIETANQKNLVIVTTEKDAVRLPENFIMGGWVLVMDMHIVEQEKWRNLINEIKK